MSEDFLKGYLFGGIFGGLVGVIFTLWLLVLK
jgi:gas vesicle protein